MEDMDKRELRVALGELLDYMESADEVAGRLAGEYAQYRAMAKAVHHAAEIVSMACELEAYSEREGDDQQ